MRWALYAILYLIGVLTLGLLLLEAEKMIAAALDVVFLVIAVVLFRLAFRDVVAALDIAVDERERAELRMFQVLLVVVFVISAGVLGYALLRALFPFVA